jgi:peptide/nickel transport system permease protein
MGTPHKAVVVDYRSKSAAEALTAYPARTLWSDTWRRYCRHRLAMLGTVVMLILSVATLLGPLVYPVPIDEIDFAVKLEGPSVAHPFGTDDLGQDLLARILYGGRISMAVGLAAMLIAILLGMVIGALAGFFGGVLDSILMRLTDLFLSLPQLPLLLLVVFLFRDRMRQAFGPELGIFMLIVGVIGGLRWMQPARLVRASFLALKEKEFVEAARCVGVPSIGLIVRHILPNALSPVIVAATLGVGSAILAESSISFLGLGFPPDMPTWGRLLSDAKDYLDLAPHWALFPGLMIFLAVISINYIGDGLRDALDPRKIL